MSTEVDCFEESVSTCRFGQRCGEIQVKVHANLEVDVHSQLREARQRVHQLQQRVLVLEEEQRSLHNTVQATQKQLENETDVDRLLSEDEEQDCEHIVGNLCERSLSGDNSKEDEEVGESIRKLSRVSLINVVHAMSQRVSDLRVLQQRTSKSISRSSSSVSAGVEGGEHAFMEEARARALLENSTSVWSLNGMDSEDQLDESKSERSEDNLSRVSPAHRHQSHSDEGSSLANSRQLDVTSIVSQSKRVRQLLEGITVVTTGIWGNSKTKLLSLSPDFKQLIWKDLSNNSTKEEDITSYKGFIISDYKPEGVLVKYEHNGRSKKMEIPRNNLEPDENRNRVLKWVGLLNSLRDTAA